MYTSYTLTFTLTRQPLLRGDGLKDRSKVVKHMFDALSGDTALMKKILKMMCAEISKERKRMGGDWVIAFAVATREMRDYVR